MTTARKLFQIVSLFVIVVTVLSACGGVPQPSNVKLPNLPKAPDNFAPACQNCADLVERQALEIKYVDGKDEKVLKVWYQYNALGNGVSYDLWSDPDQKWAFTHNPVNESTIATGPTWKGITFKIVNTSYGTRMRVEWPDLKTVPSIKSITVQ